MKILPREHGATVIWFSSILAAVLTMPTLPDPTRLLLFLSVSVSALLFTSYLTGHSPTLIRIQRNRLFLPIISGGLTLTTLLGYYIMFEAVSAKILSVWLLILTYTVISVSLIQSKVQGLLKRKPSSPKPILLPGLTVFTAESLLLYSYGLMHPATLLSMTPLLFMWLYLQRPTLPETTESKMKTIRRIGFQQTGNMIAFILILTALSRF